MAIRWIMVMVQDIRNAKGNCTTGTIDGRVAAVDRVFSLSMRKLLACLMVRATLPFSCYFHRLLGATNVLKKQRTYVRHKV